MKRSHTRRRVRAQETAWHVGVRDTRLDVSAEQIVEDLTSSGLPARKYQVKESRLVSPRG